MSILTRDLKEKQSMLVDKVKMLQKNVLLKFYKHIKYHNYYYDYNSLYQFQISSAIFFICFHSKLLTKICSESDRKFCESKVLTGNTKHDTHFVLHISRD